MAAQKLIITLADGTTIKVQPNLGDTLNFETTLRKNPRWGSLQENLLRARPFQAWSAARRTGLISSTWEEFSSGETAVLDVSPEDDDADAEAVDTDFLA